MFTCYGLSDVEYYIEEAEKVRNIEASGVLKDAEKAMLSGDFDAAADLLPEVADAARSGDREAVEAHIKSLKRELLIASNQLKRKEGDKAAEKLAAVEKRLGITPDPKKHQGRDRMTYYVDNGTESGEGKGTWWSPKLGQVMPLIDGGSEVKSADLRALARGVHHITGKPLIQNNRPERKVGYDIQFSDPKSVSVLKAAAEMAGAMRGNRLLSELIDEARDRALNRALDFVFEQELVVTRRGKGGKILEPVADCAIAKFAHSTSRAGDPQGHVHCVLLNAVVRRDGSTGTLDNQTLLRYQRGIGGAYDTELAAEMEALGLAVEKDEATFRLAGIPDDVSKLFSKRRNDIEEAAAEAGFDTADDRGRAQSVALATRNAKQETPPREEVLARWGRELDGVGWSASALIESAEAARFARDDQWARSGIDYQATMPMLRQAAAEQAVAAAESMEAVIEHRHLLKEVFDRMQGLGTIDDAMAEVIKLEAAGKIVLVGIQDDTNQRCYATAEMIAAEKSVIRNSLERRNERDFVPAAAVEAAIARKKTMTEEQADAVRHALNRDGVSIVEGSAGTGKSFSLGAVADAARDVGMHVYVLALAHKAKTVIAQDTATREDAARAVAGMIARLTNPKHPEAITLTKNDMLLIDEAGMVGTRDLNVLLEHALIKAEAVGAKVVLAGDTRQLKPVSAGSPMTVLAKLLGTQRIEKIVRQAKSEHAEWMIPASMDLATGHADRAIQTYADKGRVHFGKTPETAMAMLRDDWKRDVIEKPITPKSFEDRLVVAGTTKEVTALNSVLREAYREAGRLEGEDVIVKAFPRGKKAGAVDLKLANGDRLIFGESVKVDEGEINSGNKGEKGRLNNSDMATLLYVEKGEADPIVRLRFDKQDANGVHFDVTCKWSELVGFRKEGTPESERLPVVQHGFCVTTHASQGSTVDRGFVYNGHGMGMESTYVSMTRQRYDAQMYVDASRIIDRIESRKDVHTFALSSTGRGDGTDAEIGGDKDKPHRKGDYDDAKLTEVLLHEVMRSESKHNVSDFSEDKRAWAYDEAQPVQADELPEMTAADINQVQPLATSNLADVLAELDRLVAAGSLAPRKPLPPIVDRDDREPPDVEPEVWQSQAAEALERRMAGREHGPVYPIPDAPDGYDTERTGMTPRAQELMIKMWERLSAPMADEWQDASHSESMEGEVEAQVDTPDTCIDADDIVLEQGPTINRASSQRIIDTATATVTAANGSKPTSTAVAAGGVVSEAARKATAEAEARVAAETARKAAEAAARAASQGGQAHSM